MWVTGALFGASVLAARPVENTGLKIKNSATAPKIQHIKLVELNITSRQTLRQSHPGEYPPQSAASPTQTTPNPQHPNRKDSDNQAEGKAPKQLESIEVAASRLATPATGEPWDDELFSDESVDEGDIDLEGFDIADAESLY